MPLNDQKKEVGAPAPSEEERQTLEGLAKGTIRQQKMTPRQFWEQEMVKEPSLGRVLRGER